MIFRAVTNLSGPQINKWRADRTTLYMNEIYLRICSGTFLILRNTDKSLYIYNT